MPTTAPISAREDLVFAAKMALQVFEDHWGFKNGHGNQQIGEAWQALTEAIEKAEIRPVTSVRPLPWVIVNNGGLQNEYIVTECSEQIDTAKFLKRNPSWSLMKRLASAA